MGVDIRLVGDVVALALEEADEMQLPLKRLKIPGPSRAPRPARRPT
jgi:hypothetical protein